MAFRLLSRQLQVHSKPQRHTQLFNQLYHQPSLYSSMQAYFSSVIKLEMPALSPTMSEGNLLQWSKKEGDQVKVGDVLCEIQTDKATMGFESQEEGYLAKILVSPDTRQVQVGALIGLLVENKEDIATVDVSKYT